MSKNSFVTGAAWSSSNQYDEPQAVEFPDGRVMINMRNDSNTEGTLYTPEYIQYEGQS